MVIDPLPAAVIREAAARALGEDMGPADITTLAVVDPTRKARGRVFAKETGILSGIVLADQVFREVSPALKIRRELEDGDRLESGMTVLHLEGPAVAMLTGERSALNFLQHLSGIASLTHRFVQAVSGTRCQILDTRKTIPGLRLLAKYAVRCGGGRNHRSGLYDAFMIKDNHVALMQHPGGLVEAIHQARRFEPGAHLTVEADTIDQVCLIAEAGPDRILLDNMDTPTLIAAVKLVQGRCQLEASGNMTLERVAEVAATGVDFISVGALTHSAPALDFSLELLL
jgi:nicotinate-nucleotide pyrophosphorylase (carboxylating)